MFLALIECSLSISPGRLFSVEPVGVALSVLAAVGGRHLVAAAKDPEKADANSAEPDAADLPGGGRPPR